MKHNSAITGQNRLEFWHQKAKQGFSKQSKIFGPRPSVVKSLKEAWNQQSLIDKQKFAVTMLLHIILDFKCTKFYLILTSIY